MTRYIRSLILLGAVAAIAVLTAGPAALAGKKSDQKHATKSSHRSVSKSSHKHASKPSKKPSSRQASRSRPVLTASVGAPTPSSHKLVPAVTSSASPAD